MSEVTQILNKLESGDDSAADELLPLVYEELRKLAATRMSVERRDHTLTSTALVHEAYLRLVNVDRASNWDSRGHFFSAAAEAMRRILIDYAHRHRAKKRAGGRTKVPLDEVNLATEVIEDPNFILELDEALSILESEDAAAGELARLRLFAGMSVTEAAESLGIPRSTAYLSWRFVRSWFSLHLVNTGDETSG